MNTKNQREGLAVFIVIMVSAVIAVFTTIVIFQGKDADQRTGEKQDKAQAQYLAKGAQNHFLLKFKLLPTELYDAVSYSVGKNPFFDFSIPIQAPTNNTLFTPLASAGIDPDYGPAFFTGTNATSVGIDPNNPQHFLINRSTDGDGIYTNPAIGFSNQITVDGTSQASQDVMAYMLNHYILDIATDYPYPANGTPGVVVVSSANHNEVAQFGKADTDPDAASPTYTFPWQDPFNGTYIVRSLKILGIGGSATADAGKKYLSDTVLLTTEASIQRASQISLVTVDGSGHPKNLTVTKRTTSGIVGNNTFPELSKNLESDASYNARTSLTDASGSRTEVSTGVYFVTRKAK